MAPDAMKKWRAVPVNQGILHDMMEEQTRKIIQAMVVQNGKPQNIHQDQADGDRPTAFEIGPPNANSTLATENPAEETNNFTIVPNIPAEISAINSTQIGNNIIERNLAEISDEEQNNDSTEQTAGFTKSTATVLVVTNDEVPDQTIQPRGPDTAAEIAAITPAKINKEKHDDISDVEPENRTADTISVNDVSLPRSIETEQTATFSESTQGSMLSGTVDAELTCELRVLVFKENGSKKNFKKGINSLLEKGVPMKKISSCLLEIAKMEPEPVNNVESVGKRTKTRSGYCRCKKCKHQSKPLRDINSNKKKKIRKGSDEDDSVECDCGMMRHYVKIKESWLYWKIEEFSNGSDKTVLESENRDTRVVAEMMENMAISSSTGDGNASPIMRVLHRVSCVTMNRDHEDSLFTREILPVSKEAQINDWTTNQSSSTTKLSTMDQVAKCSRSRSPTRNFLRSVGKKLRSSLSPRREVREPAYQETKQAANLPYTEIIEDLLTIAAPNGVPLDRLDYRLPEPKANNPRLEETIDEFSKNPRTARKMTTQYLRNTEFSINYLSNYIKKILRRMPKALFRNEYHQRIHVIAMEFLLTHEKDEKVAVTKLKAVIQELPLENQNNIAHLFKHIRTVGSLKVDVTEKRLDVPGLIDMFLPGIYLATKYREGPSPDQENLMRPLLKKLFSVMVKYADELKVFTVN